MEDEEDLVTLSRHKGIFTDLSIQYELNYPIEKIHFESFYYLFLDKIDKASIMFFDMEPYIDKQHKIITYKDNHIYPLRLDNEQQIIYYRLKIKFRDCQLMVYEYYLIILSANAKILLIYDMKHLKLCDIYTFEHGDNAYFISYNDTPVYLKTCHHENFKIHNTFEFYINAIEYTREVYGAFDYCYFEDLEAYNTTYFIFQFDSVRNQLTLKHKFPKIFDGQFMVDFKLLKVNTNTYRLIYLENNPSELEFTDYHFYSLDDYYEEMKKVNLKERILKYVDKNEIFQKEFDFLDYERSYYYDNDNTIFELKLNHYLFIFKLDTMQFLGYYLPQEHKTTLYTFQRKIDVEIEKHTKTNKTVLCIENKMNKKKNMIQLGDYIFDYSEYFHWPYNYKNNDTQLSYIIQDLYYCKYNLNITLNYKITQQLIRVGFHKMFYNFNLIIKPLLFYKQKNYLRVYTIDNVLHFYRLFQICYEQKMKKAR